MIRGFFSPQWRLPMVRVGASVLNISKKAVGISAVLDTGAEKTLIGPSDAIRLGWTEEYLRDPNQWPNQDEAEGVGGKAPVFQNEITLFFQHVDGTVVALTKPYDVLGWIDDGSECPTLLGWDVLEGFDVFVSWQSKIVELR